jgi:serine/threonine protein kinase
MREKEKKLSKRYGRNKERETERAIEKVRQTNILPHSDEGEFTPKSSFLSAMYWTAPELLREALPSPKGSQKGDVYSFAIILMELFYRTSPYWDEQMIPRGEEATVQ